MKTILSVNNIQKQIIIASDHAGFKLKENIVLYLQRYNMQLINLGTDSSDPVDYPDFANSLANSMLGNPDSIGILLCGSGIGMSIAANRFCHIRAALCHNRKYAYFARAHNNSNVLILGAKFLGKNKVFDMINTFLNTEFENGRHAIRVQKL